MILNLKYYFRYACVQEEIYNELVTTLSTSILIVWVRFNNVSEYVVSRYNLLQIKKEFPKKFSLLIMIEISYYKKKQTTPICFLNYNQDSLQQGNLWDSLSIWLHDATKLVKTYNFLL